MTAVGNGMVLHAIRTERRLQTVNLSYPHQIRHHHHCHHHHCHHHHHHRHHVYECLQVSNMFIMSLAVADMTVSVVIFLILILILIVIFT